VALESIKKVVFAREVKVVDAAAKNAGAKKEERIAALNALESNTADDAVREEAKQVSALIPQEEEDKE
jgi:hypothetical protein